MFLHPSSMRKASLGRPTRSIYVSLACLSLALHLLLAFFCLSVLHTSCVLPSSTTASSSDAFAAAVRQTANQLRKSILALSLHTTSPPPPPPPLRSRLPTHLELLWDVQPRNQTITVQAQEAKVMLGEVAVKESKLIATKKMVEKLDMLFRHPLYNLPRPVKMREKDQLLVVNTPLPEKDSESYESSETSG